MYSLKADADYGTTIPQGQDAKEYTVYYKVVGDDNYNDVAAKSLKVTISPKDLSNFTVTYQPKSSTQTPLLYSVVSHVIDDQKNVLTKNQDYTVSYVYEGNQNYEYNEDVIFQYESWGDEYHCVIKGIGNYTGIITGLTQKAVSSLDYKKNADGTATITGILNSDHEYEKNLSIYITESIDDEDGNSRRVSSIASGAFSGEIGLIRILGDKKITIEEGAIGKGNSVQVNPDLIDDYANDPNVQEILKEGQLFAWLSAGKFKLMTFSSNVDVAIPQTYELSMNLNNRDILLDTFAVTDYLQVYKCKVDQSKKEVIATSILHNMKDNDQNGKPVYKLKAYNGVLLAGDTASIINYTERIKTDTAYFENILSKFTKDDLVALAMKYTEYGPLAIYATLDQLRATARQNKDVIYKRVKDEVQTRMVKIIAQYSDEKTNVTTTVVKKDYGEDNMLIPVVKDSCYKSNNDIAYYILYNGAFHAILNNNSTTPKGKAILEVPTDLVRDVSASRSLDITFDDDDTTAIYRVPETVEVPGQDLWYNLNGQRISKPTKKGLYIHNGRKVVIN